MVYYYDKEKARQGQLFCLGIEDKLLTDEEIIQQNKQELYVNYVTHIGESALLGYPIVEGDTVRSATVVELIHMGLQELQDGEYIQGDELIKIEQPSYQYKWDKFSNTWQPDEEKLYDGQYIENGQIKEISYDTTLNFLVPKWIKELKTWVEGATDSEKAEVISKELEKLNNYVDCEDMKAKGVYEDYKTYRDSLTIYINRTNQGLSLLIEIPQPSEKLLSYINRRKEEGTL